MRSPLSTIIVVFFLLAWLTVTAALFASVSRVDFVHVFVIPSWPRWLELVARIPAGQYALDLLGALLGAIAFSAACVSLGLTILRRWGKSEANYLALATTAFIAGEVVYSLIFLTCIILYKLTPQIGAAILALGLLIGLRRNVAFFSNRRSGGFLSQLTRGDKIVLGLVLAVMLLAIMYSSARLSYDAVIEDLSQAKIMAVTQTAAYTYPKDPFLVSSFHSGILYTALIQLFGDQSARMLSWFNGLAILVLGLAIGEEAGLSPRARLWVLVLLVTTTAYMDLLGDGKVELISTAALLTGVYWMLRGAKAPSESTFALIGFLIGFAMIARPYNIFLAPLFMVVFYTIHLIYRSRDQASDFRRFTWMAVWMLPSLCAMGAFHLLQNWLWLGNPIAPLVEGTHLSASLWQVQSDPRLLNVYRLLYPVTITFVNSPQSLGNISPFFVGGLPFLLIRRVRDEVRERPILLQLTLAAIITLILWIVLFFTVVEIRYVLFAWVLLFVFIAQAIDSALGGMGLPMRIMTRATAWLLLIFMGARAAVIAVGTYSPIDARGQAHCYDLGYCTFLMPLNDAAPTGARVFVLNAYRYYLRPDLFACSSRAQEYAKMESLAQQNSPEFWVELYRGGFQYVTFETNYAVFHSHFGNVPSLQSIPSWLHVSQTSATTDGLLRIYRIDAAKPPIQPGSYCDEEPGGIWQIRSGMPQG